MSRVDYHVFTQNIDFKDHKSLIEVHDYFMVRAEELRRREIRAERVKRENTVIPINEQTQNILDCFIEGFNIVAPTKGRDMIEWSDKMKNCIADHMDLAINRDNYTYLGVEKNGNLIANVQIVDKKITQFLGRNNSPLKDEYLKEVKPLLDTWMDAGVVSRDTTRAWGLVSQDG